MWIFAVCLPPHLGGRVRELMMMLMAMAMMMMMMTDGGDDDDRVCNLAAVQRFCTYSHNDLSLDKPAVS